MKIAILGAGAFGTALGGILLNKGHEISYFDPKIKGSNLEDTLRGAETIIIATPSEAVPTLLPLLPKQLPLIVATKGLLSDEYLRDFKNWNLVSGPGFAEDIKAGKPTKLTATDMLIVKLLATDYFTFDMTSDKKGVLLCGALKNAYAIGAGMRDLKPKAQVHEDFLKQAINEMAAILKINGADPATVKLACGEDDLRITCYYPSRNYEFGQKIRLNSGLMPQKTVEGFSVLKRIRRGEILIPENAKILKELLEVSKTWG